MGYNMSVDPIILALTADIVKAQISKNTVSSSGICALITDVYATFSSLGQASQSTAGRMQPAVSVRASVTDDYLICLEDGKKFKMLKRHLMAHYQMTPDEYRAKWGLPEDYPMIAPNYAQKRSKLASQLGLGHKSREGKSIEKLQHGAKPVLREQEFPD
tara:strand:+ start:5050 stop:5526 length:477 start_codon:yes stop_codon:yes gene_type:complete